MLRSSGNARAWRSKSVPTSTTASSLPLLESCVVARDGPASRTAGLLGLQSMGKRKL